MTNDKGKQFFLRVSEEHVHKAMYDIGSDPHGCSTCPVANALLDIGIYAPYVRPEERVTAWGHVGDNAGMVYIKSDSLRKAIRDFDETNEFETGLYLCGLV